MTFVALEKLMAVEQGENGRGEGVLLDGRSGKKALLAVFCACAFHLNYTEGIGIVGLGKF